MSILVRCWKCHRFLKLGIWRWWTRRARCPDCKAINRIVKRWMTEKPQAYHLDGRRGTTSL